MVRNKFQTQSVVFNNPARQLEVLRMLAQLESIIVRAVAFRTSVSHKCVGWIGKIAEPHTNKRNTIRNEFDFNSNRGDIDANHTNTHPNTNISTYTHHRAQIDIILCIDTHTYTNCTLCAPKVVRPHKQKNAYQNVDLLSRTHIIALNFSVTEANHILHNVRIIFAFRAKESRRVSRVCSSAGVEKLPHTRTCERFMCLVPYDV